VSVIAACTASRGNGGYFFEEREKRSPITTSIKMKKQSVFLIPLFYHYPRTSNGTFFCHEIRQERSAERKREAENTL